jgi:hypothetical protein
MRIFTKGIFWNKPAVFLFEQARGKGIVFPPARDEVLRFQGRFPNVLAHDIPSR